jgi:methionine synthase II (cobalamin-independent)
VGSIRLLSPNLGTEYGGRYSLQAAGIRVSGNYQRWQMNASVAKGIGDFKAWNAYNIESTPRNWRVYGSLTYRF